MRALLLVLVATGSLAAAVPALGQSVGMKPIPNINLAGFGGDPTALPSAVATIEQLSGGRVAEIRYNNVDGIPGYDVALAQGNEIRFQRYHKPANKPLTLTETKTPTSMLNWQGQKNASLVTNAKIPLADAIRTAESAMRGAPAVAAGIAQGAADPSTDVHAYNVAILKDGQQHRVAVNSDSGAVIANPEALPSW
ncbi:PepSY domain-containing protein [Phenylobacterium sp. LjRoot219]|uniref:PepSY domain-containing protein n=1 Tax=Phenylobacterium sp. LjRoot219 TaxID=3342283 RepID=UPI003ECD2041